MKMKNEDLKAITAIKQYLLDPPVSFKLNDYAIDYLQNAIAVLRPYPDAGPAIEGLQETLQSLQENAIAREDLRKLLQEEGRKMSRLTIM